MICYRELIKDIINYSFNHFKVLKGLNNNLWNKAIGIKEVLYYSNNKRSELTQEEKKIYSNIISNFKKCEL